MLTTSVPALSLLICCCKICADTCVDAGDCVVQEASKRIAVKCNFEESDRVGVTGLCCRTPDGGVLFDNMTFSVQPGERLLIMGPSGVGKSSLLRIIAGLWPVDDGIVYRYGKR